MMRRTAVLVMLGALAIVALAACGSDDGKISIDTPEGNVEVDPDGNGGSVEFSGPDGEGGSVNIGGGEVPDDFPDDIPLPDDFEVTSSVSGGDGDGIAAASVTGLSGESFDDLVSMYEDGIPDAGYDVTSSGSTNVNGSDTFTMGFDGNGVDGGALSVSSDDYLSDDSDKRLITITLGTN
ncbi:MAG: hypothetical protein M5U31_02775 [Acidimicrobiia bacterium]|nr:hypothetical protein [Acidimicrobiia bacterium]